MPAPPRPAPPLIEPDALPDDFMSDDFVLSADFILSDDFIVSDDPLVDPLAAPPLVDDLVSAPPAVLLEDLSVVELPEPLCPCANAGVVANARATASANAPLNVFIARLLYCGC
jgi:hypothetical protein